MVKIIQTLDQVGPGYRVLYCDLWGCLHNGVEAFPEAVAALERFREKGGAVALITNAPRPGRDILVQLDRLGVRRSAYDAVVSSGDAAQEALQAGLVGRRVHHIGPERDLSFFVDATGAPFDVELVPLPEAEGIVCTGLFDDRTETPEDYRETVLYGKAKGLKLLCANPDIIVDVGHTRIYCAGAIALAYAEAGGTSLYFGKPHPPIYRLTAQRMAEQLGRALEPDEILCVGDGIATDILGAVGEGLDALFVTGGIAATETATTETAGPDPARLDAFLDAARISTPLAMAFLR